MDSDLQRQNYSHHFQGLQKQFQPPKQQMNAGGGLTRYRSAPSSYFSTFLDTAADAGDLSASQPRPLSPETESILARFMQNVADGGGGGSGSQSHKLCDIPENSPAQFTGTVKKETEQIHSFTSNNNNTTTNNSSSSNNNNVSSSSPMLYQSNQSNKKPPLMGGSSSGMDSTFRIPSSVGMDFSSSHMKMNSGGGRSNSNLIRHRSSPAGLFDDIIIENGYLVSRETEAGNYGSGNRTGKSNEFSSTVGRMNDQMNFSSGQTQLVAANSDGSGGGRSMGINGLNDTRRFTSSDDDNFVGGFQMGSWDDTSMFSDQFSGSEMGGGDLNLSENQNRESKNRPPGLLAHHLSLPKASLEKLLQFQDSVPCNIRAKRGCATHPRSIAERVRRNKISERMRKLQDLVPNMDKQTNTSDMLDLAVDYIKDLQEQVKMLTGKRARCTCTS